MKNKLQVASVIILFTLFITFFGFGSPDDNPHGDISQDCQDCHTSKSWKHLADPMKFDHDKTGFRLDGSHATADCASCHKDLVFGKVGQNCADCHADHHLGQLGNDCQSCHTPRDWEPRKDLLELHISRGFPLTGVHAIADCESCHLGNDRQEFAGTPTDCKSCHLEDLATATDPDHSQQPFSSDCENCHRAGFATWNQTLYAHTAAFPLTGAHKFAECSDCHFNGFMGTSSACYDCHQVDYESTTNPNHVQVAMATTCQDCHNTSTWTPATFDHNATGFPLTGTHKVITCISCHATQYAGTPTDCYSCHQTNFEATTDPNHVQSGFNTTCNDCHSTSAWMPATFDHNQTSFPLTGAHLSIACIACHATQYTGTPVDCFACHQTDFEGTTDPNHVQSGFNTNCEDCHSTNAWVPGMFDHNQTSFPLTGLHIGVSCISCHLNQYAGTPTNCYSCHQTDYESTNDPNHLAASFSTDCAACHNTSGWNNTSWDHDAMYFPIYSGVHRGEWNNCTDCHTVSSNFEVFECTNCHEHSKSSMDNKHSGVNGYQYLSTACYNCHPRGRN